MKIFKIVFGTFLILFIILIIIFEDDLNTSHACGNLKRFKKSVYSGTVIKIYIDQKNHRAPTVQIGDGSDPVLFVLPGNTDDFYNYILPGDSLIKIRGNDYFEVYRASILKRFIINYGCNSK